MTFTAWVAREDGDEIAFGPEEVDESFLPEGLEQPVTIRVHHSTVNYKDVLALTPKAGVVRSYPIVPGIDLAGEVVSSESADFSPGDRVLAHGYGVGTAQHGGYAELARVPAAWVVPLRDLSTADAAAIGTAGYTAARSVQALLGHGLTTDDGPVLVTGASGGVGSVSVDLLAALGFEVVASSGKESARELLTSLGASEVVGRIPEDPDEKLRPLARTRWAAAVDCVGGRSLAFVLSQLRYGGAVAASGLTGGGEVPTTVHPFILRGVALLGIDSVNNPIAERRALWDRLGTDLRPAHLADLTHEVGLADVPRVVQQLRDATFTGRTLVRVAG